MTYCLEIRTLQAVAMKVLGEALKELLTNTCIEFDETGMKIVATDTTHVVLVHLKRDASKFEVYHCDGRLAIGVNMLNMHKLIRTVNNNDQLTLFIDKDDINHLGIKIENTEKNSKTTYKLNLLDLDHHNISVDPINFTEVVTLPSADFRKICRDMYNLADYMEIKSIQSQLIFSCTGEFCCQETIICDNDNMCVIGTTTGGDKKTSNEIVHGVFSIRHLVLFTKCTNLCSAMELYLKNDYPLIIKYDVASLGTVCLALAPQAPQHAS